MPMHEVLCLVAGADDAAEVGRPRDQLHRGERAANEPGRRDPRLGHQKATLVRLERPGRGLDHRVAHPRVGRQGLGEVPELYETFRMYEHFVEVALPHRLDVGDGHPAGDRPADERELRGVENDGHRRSIREPSSPS